MEWLLNHGSEPEPEETELEENDQVWYCQVL